jgi:hypothetical protein
MRDKLRDFLPPSGRGWWLLRQRPVERVAEGAPDSCAYHESVSQFCHSKLQRFFTSHIVNPRLNLNLTLQGSPLVLRSGYEWRGCPQAVSREYHRTRNKNKQTNKVAAASLLNVAWPRVVSKLTSQGFPHQASNNAAAGSVNITPLRQCRGTPLYAQLDRNLQHCAAPQNKLSRRNQK